VIALLRKPGMNRPLDPARRDRSSQDAEIARIGAGIAQAFAGAHATQAALQRVAEEMVDGLGLSFVRIWCVEPSRAGGLALEASASGADLSEFWTAAADLVVQRVFQMHRPYWVPNLQYSLADPAMVWARDARLASFAAFPLTVRGRAVGMLAFGAAVAMDTRSLVGIQSLAAQLAIGIDHRRLESELGMLRQRPPEDV
jgi:GAF domain-containing protein